MTARHIARLVVPLAAVVAIVCAPALASAQATITIVNINGPGVGFNDPTPVAPVGGNPGTTLGAQRLNAFQYAANIWGARLNSGVEIKIRAQFSALSCTATSATLGSAGARTVHANFTGAPNWDTWYSQALANSLFGADLDDTREDISANFNVNLGNANCLAGSGWYLGFDANHGALIDLPAVLLHEFGHGLGFQTFTSGTTGAFLGTPPIAFPSVWDQFLYDNTQGMNWTQMTAAQRVTSAINFRKLVWAGTEVTSKASQVLGWGMPFVVASAPASLAGDYNVGTASFGPALSSPGVSGDLMPVVAQTDDGGGRGCSPFNAVNTAAVNGNIALIDRGVCSFVIKVKNAQNAGARGVIIADNVAGSPAGLGGSDPTITIPSVRVSLADGNLFKSYLKYRSRTKSGLIVRLTADMTMLTGADRWGRLLMYTPNPFQSGSSVSHFDTIASPNLLMEPAINGDLTHNVMPPWDLTLPLLKDIGWSINY